MTVDIGLIGYAPEEMVPDGNHRLAAAHFRGDRTIRVEIIGDFRKAKAVFWEGVYIDDYRG